MAAASLRAGRASISPPLCASASPASPCRTLYALTHLMRAGYPLDALGSVSPTSYRGRVRPKEAQMLGTPNRQKAPALVKWSWHARRYTESHQSTACIVSPFATSAVKSPRSPAWASLARRSSTRHRSDCGMHPQWRGRGSRIEYRIALPPADSGRGGLGCVGHDGTHRSLGKHCESLPAEVRVRPDAGSPVRS
jgi:hypothetical protein